MRWRDLLDHLDPVGLAVSSMQSYANFTARADLFTAAIGVYGAAGVITEVELELALNGRIERRVSELPLESYAGHFALIDVDSAHEGR